jgi:hypothetical protein
MVINRINIEDNKGASYEKILKTLQMVGTKIIFSSCGNSGMHVAFFAHSGNRFLSSITSPHLLFYSNAILELNDKSVFKFWLHFV